MSSFAVHAATLGSDGLAIHAAITAATSYTHDTQLANDLEALEETGVALRAQSTSMMGVIAYPGAQDVKTRGRRSPRRLRPQSMLCGA